jgi:preprotein translocase subunit SecA
LKTNNSLLSYYKKKVETINDIKLVELSDNELLQRSRELINRARQGDSLEGMLIEAFALVKEVAFRTIGLKAYDEQLMAGIAMHEGNLVEMQTGEGKTLTAVFPAYLNGISGIGVDIFTYNDYLAQRDAGLMGPIYNLLGLTVGFIKGNMNRQERIDAYNCDITYVTAKEAGFDYLRNFLCYTKENLIHRSFNYIIVDEADSILIDEARIPLVIAASGAESDKSLNSIREIICQLEKDIDYEMDENAQNVNFTNVGIDFIEGELECGNLYAEENLALLSELLDALQGEVLFHKDVDYIVREGKIELIDEFTGRTAENRHWPDGIQAAVETKEGLKRQSEGRIMNQITLQNFIMLHKKISGMTGTAKDAANEFMKFYNLEVVIIPTHKPCIRRDYLNVVFTHKEAKYKALIKEVIEVHKTGQPILIGTGSIRESVYVAGELKRMKVESQVLNAKNDEREAHIIEQAGALSAVTVSTNMAGRGTDIKLGGLNEYDHEKVVELGGLYIIGTNIYESHRIDKQLRGRAGRQGDPGLSKFFISLEDDLIIKYGVENVIPEGKELKKQEEPINNIDILDGIEHLRRIVQGKNLDLRQWLWRYSYIIEKQIILVQNRRMEILLDITPSCVLAEKEPELYGSLSSVIEKDTMQYLEKKTALFYIDNSWSDYLEYILDIRDISYMAVLKGRNPIDTFEAEAVKTFSDFEDRVAMHIISEFKKLEPTQEGILALLKRMDSPPSTFTYLLKENSYDGSLALKLNRAGVTSFALMFAAPFLLLKRLFNFLKNKHI